jgi:hypothetical protein
MNGRRILGIPRNGRKDKDEELVLFRELLHNREERILNLLQPVSEEFEPHAAASGMYPSIDRLIFFILIDLLVCLLSFNLLKI